MYKIRKGKNVGERREGSKGMKGTEEWQNGYRRIVLK
jgi:hypothetical protein